MRSIDESVPGARSPDTRFAQRVLPRWMAGTAISLGILCCAAQINAQTNIQTNAQTPPAPAARFVVVLDAAHGGDDAGGHSGNWTEKTFTLALSVRLRSLLMARGIQVVTTREEDATLDAEHRDAIANQAQAQACLSLHASLSGNGIHLFVSSLAPAAPGRPVPGLQTRFVPWKTAQATAVARSLGLAGVVNSALGQAGLGVTLGRTALPVVDSMACPAVAVEVAPDASRGQSATDSLSDANYQAKVAEALTAALVEWRGNALETGARQP
jgi:N-acetylmuramoyl-L-alanine amidase